VSADPAAAALADEPPAGEQRVSALELFFDLVFVFAITQVTGYVGDEATWTRLMEGLAILAVLWWAWGCYAWLGNSAGTDDGLFRVVLLLAMAAMLIVALAMPHAFGADALTFGVAYFAVRALHILAYVVLSRDDPQMRVAVRGLARSMIPAGGLILAAGLVGAGAPRTVCWVLALAVDVGGLWLFGVEGWRVEPAHLAERYSGMIIIALGESVVSLGLGAKGLPLDAGIITGALLGIGTAAALWWAYFDVVALVAERRFRRAVGRDRVRIARDSYTYLHLPMVAGIVLFALGVEQTLEHTGRALEPVPATAMCGGLALYLLAHVAFRLRNVHRLNVARLVSAGVLVALIPVATSVDALASLAIVTALCTGLMVYEGIRYAELREHLRHAG
jgi:low temperature requirement protein LtrA